MLAHAAAESEPETSATNIILRSAIAQHFSSDVPPAAPSATAPQGHATSAAAASKPAAASCEATADAPQSDSAAVGLSAEATCAATRSACDSSAVQVSDEAAGEASANRLHSNEWDDVRIPLKTSDKYLTGDIKALLVENRLAKVSHP